MDAAAIGLIGVIVGAVLAGAIRLVLDRRKRLARVRVAGRLIGAELQVAEKKVTSAVEAAKTVSSVTNGSNTPKPGDPAVTGKPPAINANGWWLGDLPTDA
jgi:hypothetical protein